MCHVIACMNYVFLKNVPIQKKKEASHYGHLSMQDEPEQLKYASENDLPLSATVLKMLKILLLHICSY